LVDVLSAQERRWLTVDVADDDVRPLEEPFQLILRRVIDGPLPLVEEAQQVGRGRLLAGGAQALRTFVTSAPKPRR